MTVQLLDLDVRVYEPHPLHAIERTWTETNCYVDLWIEVLHTLGLDPVAAAAFTLSTDFEGDQWSFSKFPPEDLRALWGLEVAEMNVWRPVTDHVATQLALGRLLTVEVDSWYLPDSAGITYHEQHGKTTIVPNSLDMEGRRLGYFHAAGYYELEGEDFDGLFHLGGAAAPEALAPYMEIVRLERLIRPEPGELEQMVLALARDHLGRRPPTSPILRFRKRLEQDLEWLATQELETFHQYAFATCRQCGGAAELAADFVDWIDARAGGQLAEVAEHLRGVSTAAKSLQFGLARVVRGRRVDIGSVLDEMDGLWQMAMDALSRHLVV